LYEAGYGDPKSQTPGLIGVTEPRRVAAVSTAQRVAFELNQPLPSIEDESGGTASTSFVSKPKKVRNSLNLYGIHN